MNRSSSCRQQKRLNFKKLLKTKQKHKEKQKTPSFNSPQIIKLDSQNVLALIEYFINQGILKQQDLQRYLKQKDNPLVQNELDLSNRILDKGELRKLWHFQIKHHQCFCSICGQPITNESNNSPWRLTAEHRYPKSKGGKSDSTNLDPAHSKCNSLKTNYLPQIWEKIGFLILKNNGIYVDFDKVKYNYVRNFNEKER